MTEQALVRTLRDTITDEVIQAAGLSPQGWPRQVLALLIRPAAARFAALFAAFDRDIAQHGLTAAACRILPHFVQGYRAQGTESIPVTGPLLVAANHPGATDGVVIAAALPRDDLKIVVSDIPFLRALPAARAHAIYASAEPVERVRAVREVIRHLQAGGALLIFPSGHLDADPAFMPGAEEGLDEWSRSVALVVRHVPQVRLLAAIVGGVLEPRFLSHPLVRLGPQGWQRQKLAEALQIVQHLLFGTRSVLTPSVTFGQPVTAAQLRRPEGSSGDLEQTIVEYARQVLALHLNAQAIETGSA